MTEYEWDYRNRLTKVTFKDNSAEHNVTKTVDYAYDVFNRLVKETVTVGAAVTQTVFVYDGIETVLQFEKTGSGDVSAGDLAHRYLWGSAVDQILASESPLPLGEGQGDGFDLTTPGTVLWSLTDHQGSVRDIVDNSGTPVDHRVYDSFGKPTSTPATDFIFGYTGKLFDAATGLQNNLNRWYDPSVGRWLSEDPLGFGAGDANQHRYVGNCVMTRIDPSGLRKAMADDSGFQPKGRVGDEVDKDDSTDTARTIEDIITNNPTVKNTIVDAAKNTTDKEQGGFILQSKDGTIKIVKVTSDKSDKFQFNYYYFVVDGKKVIPTVSNKGTIDVKDIKKGKPDTDWTIFSVWHCHPAEGDAWPSKGDMENSSSNKLPGPVIQYRPGLKTGRTPDPDIVDIHIVDENGNYYHIPEWKVKDRPAKQFVCE